MTDGLLEYPIKVNKDYESDGTERNDRLAVGREL